MEKVHCSLVDKKAKIAVLCGGMSSEREVSLRSGKNCFEALKRLGYENSELVDVDKNIAATLTGKSFEIAYIALHGKYGEDGCIQGLLEVLGIPYTGSGVKASSIAMDKEFTKRILKAQNLPVAPSLVINSCRTAYREIEELYRAGKIKLNFPVMVKPVCEGSSIGMTKADSFEQLEESIKEAAKYNTGIMIEEFIYGQSITVGVLDSMGRTFATPILEFRTKTSWYDYEAKYTEGMTEFILPAEIDDELTRRIQDLAVKSHQAIEAKGMSRVDFVVDEHGNPFILEINTIPGMTDLSDLPAQSKAMGISYDQLVEIILNSAVSVDTPLICK